MPSRNGTGIALLADETRRRIIAQLALRPSRPSAVADALGLSRPATSRQLRLLQAAGLVRVRPSYIDGRGLVYSLDPAAHRQITAWLAGTGVGLRGASGERVALAPDEIAVAEPPPTRSDREPTAVRVAPAHRRCRVAGTICKVTTWGTPDRPTAPRRAEPDAGCLERPAT